MMDRRRIRVDGDQEPVGIEIIFVLDESGSMNLIKSDVVGSFNSFIAEQKNLPDTCPTWFTLVSFNDKSRVVCECLPLDQVQPLSMESFVPSGQTALLDALGDVLKRAKRRMEQHKRRAVVAIMTDGEENASKRFSAGQVGALIQELEGLGWTFVYLGANQDAFQEASKLGIHPATTTSYSSNSSGIKQAYSFAGKVLTQSRTNANAGEGGWNNDGDAG